MPAGTVTCSARPSPVSWRPHGSPTRVSGVIFESTTCRCSTALRAAAGGSVSSLRRPARPGRSNMADAATRVTLARHRSLGVTLDRHRRPATAAGALVEAPDRRHAIAATWTGQIDSGAYLRTAAGVSSMRRPTRPGLPCAQRSPRRSFPQGEPAGGGWWPVLAPRPCRVRPCGPTGRVSVEIPIGRCRRAAVAVGPYPAGRCRVAAWCRPIRRALDRLIRGARPRLRGRCSRLRRRGPGAPPPRRAGWVRLPAFWHRHQRSAGPRRWSTEAAS